MFDVYLRSIICNLHRIGNLCERLPVQTVASLIRKRPQYCSECGTNLHTPVEHNRVSQIPDAVKACPECGMSNGLDAEFCINCGTKFHADVTLPPEIVTCPKCGFENPPALNFCTQCGAALKGEKPKTRKPLLIVGIALLILAVLLVAGLIIAWFTEFIPHDTLDPLFGVEEQATRDDDDRDSNADESNAEREDPDETAETTEDNDTSDDNSVTIAATDTAHTRTNGNGNRNHDRHTHGDCDTQSIANFDINADSHRHGRRMHTGHRRVRIRLGKNSRPSWAALAQVCIPALQLKKYSRTAT